MVFFLSKKVNKKSAVLLTALKFDDL